MEEEPMPPFRVGDNVIINSAPGSRWAVIAVIPDRGTDALNRSTIYSE